MTFAPEREVATLPTPTQGAVLGELRDKLAELIEVTPDEIDVDLPLINLGLDSLILMEAITFLEQRYEITLRASQVIEELDTLERLAGHIERVAGTQVAPPQATTALDPLPQEVATLPTVPSATDGDSSPVRIEEEQAQGFVSWFPDQRQRSVADATSEPGPALVDEFTRRLAGSKLHADRYRRTHADPRSAASFREAIKEVVVPVVASRAAGSRIWDIDGNEYLDMAMGFGSLLFGHGYEPIRRALERQVANGWGVGPVPFLAGPLSEEICELTGQDRANFVASGTEAIMLATRLARFATGRQKIAVFRGSYHGWWDGTLVVPGAHRGSALPAVGGVVGRAEDDVVLLPWGDDAALDILGEHGSSLAAIIVEPVQSRRPNCQPVELIAGLRQFADRHGILLVFDETITGFRLGPSGAAGIFGVKPDIATFGKALGGGLPVGCVAGRRELLDGLDGGVWRYGDRSVPEAPTTFGAGTFAKHPLSVAAAWAVVQEVKRLGSDLYDELERRSARLQTEVNGVLREHGVDAELARCASMFRFMSRQNLDAFYAALIRHGCYLWEGRSMFMSWMHDDDDIDHFVGACAKALEDLNLGRRHDPSPAIAPPETEDEDLVELPLTPNQRQLAFAYRAGSQAAQGFHNVGVFDLDGPLDVAAMDRALRAVARRHDGLRTTFDFERDVEIVHPSTSLGLEVIDVDGLTGVEQKNTVDALIDRACTEPFDLVNGPLWRFHLVRESPMRSRMVVACSDLVADGWSISLVLSEVTRLYDAEVTGEDADLDPPSRLGTLREWLASDERRAEVAAGLEYWADLLADVDLSPALPPSTSRADTSYVKTRAKRQIDSETMAGVREVGRKQGITQFSVLLGAFAALVHRVGGRTDFVVGIPTAGRPRPTPELRSVVASLTTPVAIRVRVDGETTVAELLKAVQRSVFEGVDRAAPVDELARKRAQTSGYLGPILPLMFNLDPLREVPPLSGGVRITIGSPERTFGVLPFSVQACPCNDGTVSVSFDAASSMYDADMVEAWADYYVGFVAQIVADSSIPVGSLGLGVRT